MFSLRFVCYLWIHSTYFNLLLSKILIRIHSLRFFFVKNSFFLITKKGVSLRFVSIFYIPIPANDRVILWDSLHSRGVRVSEMLKSCEQHSSLFSMAHLLSGEIDVLLLLVSAQIHISNCKVFQCIAFNPSSYHGLVSYSFIDVRKPSAAERNS